MTQPTRIPDQPGDCIHGFDYDWCAACKNSVYSAPLPASPEEQCCAPSCTRRLVVVLGGLPLCQGHRVSVEAAVRKGIKYKDDPELIRKDPEVEALLDAIRQENCPTNWVYFIRLGENIKVGYTTSLYQRFVNLTSYIDGEILAIEHGGRNLERRLHRQFIEHRVTSTRSKEIFHDVPEIREYIRSGRKCTWCDEQATAETPMCEDHQSAVFPDFFLVGRTSGPSASVPA